jgi:RNA polymerase sigma-70 factor (ECF subfamily)
MAIGYKEIADSELVTEYRNGNINAFNILFKRYFNKLYQYARRHTQNNELAEELVMDLMLWLWTKRDTVKLEGDISAYLFKAIKNAIYNHFRKKVLEMDSIDIHPEGSFMASDATDGAISMKELRSKYNDHINELSPQRQKIFLMSREENLSYKQIALKLNLSVKTVENHIAASIKHLKENFKEYANFLILLEIFRHLK